MKPIKVDGFFKRKDFNDKIDSNLKFNEQIEQTVVAEDITEEYYKNTDMLNEAGIVIFEGIPKYQIRSIIILKNQLMLKT